MKFLVVLSLLALCRYAAAVTTYDIHISSPNCGTAPNCRTSQPTNWFLYTSGPWATQNTVTGSPNALARPSYTVSVGDALMFTRDDTAGSHPFVVCMNSDNDRQCQGSVVAGNNLTMPITQTGATATWTPTAAGTYWYGCNIHNQMGGQITVVATGAAETICTYYTRALTAGGSASANDQAAFMGLVVTRAVLGNTTATTPAVNGIVAADAPTKRYFDGSIACINGGGATPSTVNFLQNGGNNAQYQDLAAKLVAFFGTALGCNAPGYIAAAQAQVRGSMWEAHKFMPINNAEMMYFNNQIVNTVLSYTNNGALLRSGDAAILVGFLNGFNRGATDGAIAGMGLNGGAVNNGVTQQICNAADCPLAASAVGFAYNTSSPMVVLTALLSVFAMFFVRF